MNNPILLTLFEYLPMIVVALGVIVVAFILWQRAPLSSLLLVLACASSLVVLIANPFVYEAVVHLGGSDAHSVASIDFAFQIGWSFFRAGYLILMVFAIYAGRKQP